MNKGVLFLNFSSDRPDPPASQPVVSQLSTQSLVLSWTGPSYDGGTAVLGYIVELRQEGLDKHGGWTEVASRCKNTSYHVSSGLEPLGQYHFRVRAYNSAGVSEPSQESKCIKMATASKRCWNCETFKRIWGFTFVLICHLSVFFVFLKKKRRKSPSRISLWPLTPNTRSRTTTMCMRSWECKQWILCN